MHQNDAEAMQQNATQLNLILIPWNRISITTLSSIISKHSTQTILPHPHHTLSPSSKQVQETHEPRIFQSCYSQSNYHKQDFSTSTSRSSALWSNLNTSSRLHLESTYNPHLQHHSNWRRIRNPVGHLQWSSLAQIISVLRLLAIFAEELYRGYSTRLSMQLYPIT